MSRLWVVMVGIGTLFGSTHTNAQLRYEQGFTAFNGHTYQVPTPGQPCNSAPFNDHGMSVRLCVDNLGVPLPPVNAGSQLSRAPTSIKR
jgi:hypothetical protein